MADEEVWDIQLMKRLIAAVPTHPTFETACASQGVTVETVCNWIRRGQQPGASEVLYRFALAIGQAEASHAAGMYAEYQRLIAEPYGAGSAKVLMSLIEQRWQLGKHASVLSLASKGPKKTDDLRALLLRPTARVRAMLNETGWRRDENWEPPVKLLAAPQGDNEDT